MEKLIIMLLAVIFLLTGCSGSEQSDATESENNKEINKMPNSINLTTKADTEIVDTSVEINDEEYFFELIESQKPGNKEGVCWDGSKATKIEDELADSEITDGRYFSDALSTYRADMLIEVAYSSNFKLVDVNEKEKDNCHFVDGDYEIKINQIDYDKVSEELESSKNYRKTDSVFLHDHKTKYFERYELFVGLKEMDGVMKSGYTLILESNLDERSYIIEVYGLGNMNVINSEACIVMNNFGVLWF